MNIRLVHDCRLVVSDGSRRVAASHSPNSRLALRQPVIDSLEVCERLVNEELYQKVISQGANQPRRGHYKPN